MKILSGGYLTPVKSADREGSFIQYGDRPGGVGAMRE